MVKAHNRTYWENAPSDKSPINKHNLNNIEVSVDIIDDRVIVLDATKLDKTTAATMVKNVTYNESTGIFTVIYLNGATATIDTKLEKITMNWGYDAAKEQLILTLDDGTKQYVDLSALITQYQFLDTDTINFVINSNGEVSADIKEGSIEERHLRPDYLADIKVESAKAQASASVAVNSANAAELSADRAEQAAATAGWADFDIDDRGHLIFTKTDNLETEFALTDEGRLEVIFYE